MAAETKVNIITLEGQQDVEIKLEDYRAAQAHNMSFSQYMNNKFPTNLEQHGSAFAQMMRSSGMFLSDDKDFGIRPPTLEQLFNPTVQLNGNVITRPDGSASQTPAGRVLFPAVLIDILESQLRDDKEGYVGMFYDMVAFTSSINSPKYDQVIVDYSNPQAARGQPISQLTRPNRMLTITTSSISRTIPTYAVGMEISAEAVRAATLDLVALAMREHALEERAAIVDRDLVGMVNGDVDAGFAALPSVTAQSFDAAIVAAGNMTQKAWVKYLRTSWRKRNITDIICDIDTYLAIEGRTGRPTKEQEPAVDERLNAIPRIRNPGVPTGVSFFVTETSLLGANTLVGLDRSKAMRRMIYVGAAYNAVEEFVLRNSMAMRVDWAERIERAGYDDAFSKMTLTV